MLRRFLLTIYLLVLAGSPLIGQAVTLSPSTIEITSSVAEVVESSFTVYNAGSSELTYFLDLLAFEPSEEDGTPLFTPEKTFQSEFISWIDFPTREVFVPAVSKVEVPFRVVVPDDIAAGSYYGAITVSTAPTDIIASNGTTIEAKTAILVFLTIEGETVEKLELLDFTLERSDASHAFGLFSYRLQNQGNVHLTPVGEIRLIGMFGQTIAVMNANEQAGRVLPNSTRTYTVLYEQVEEGWLQRAGTQMRGLALGPVHAQLALTYGSEGVITASVPSWMLIPWELLNLMFLILLALGGVFAFARLKQKKTP